MSRSLVTRLLHMLLALAVLHQLLTSLVMRGPWRGGGLGWQMHESVGAASLGILMLFWLWTVLRRGETRPRDLFPWLSRAGRAALWRDGLGYLAALRRFRLPHATHSPVASAVHGAGLLTATATAATGACWFLKGIAPQLLVRTGLELHGALANLMWAYLIAHAGLALLHELTGQRVLARMAPVRLGARIEQVGAD